MKIIVSLKLYSSCNVDLKLGYSFQPLQRNVLINSIEFMHLVCIVQPQPKYLDHLLRLCLEGGRQHVGEEFQSHGEQELHEGDDDEHQEGKESEEVGTRSEELGRG